VETGMKNLAKTCFTIISFLVISLASLTSVQSAENSSVLETANASLKSGVSGENDRLVDRFQRTYEVLQNNEVATSGAARGETLYFYKCWMCHQEVASDGDLSGLVGPSLHDLMERSVSEEVIAARIKDGGPRMPAFRHTFSDADIADLISYLLSPACCYENQNPPVNPQYLAETNPWPVPITVNGGPHGSVRLVNGQPLEGIKVQLIAPNAVRTTVFSGIDGRYEFPMVQDGTYTLRVATPLPYKPYVREGISIEGAMSLAEIVLEPVPSATQPMILEGALPPTPEVMSQLSGAEWLWNLSGTIEEKTMFAKSCGIGCHSYELILRNRYDERSWRLIVERMKTGPQGGPGRGYFTASQNGAIVEREIDILSKWLASVRGPDSEDMPVRMWSKRPTGSATRVVVTEYEANRRLLNLHDVCGAADGKIWYSSHHAPWVGYLDPKTGIIKEYRLPDVAGRPTIDTHACLVDDNNGVVWFTQGPPQTGTWALFRLTVATGEIRSYVPTPIAVNFGLAPDGFLWYSRNVGNSANEIDTPEIVRFNPNTGEIANVYPRSNFYSYQHAVSEDGRFVAGSGPIGPGFKSAWMLDVEEEKVYETTATQDHGAGRGGFDKYGDAWFGGRGGPLVQIVNEIDEGKGIHTRLHWPPTPLFPYTDFYTASPDKNGEVWGGVMHGRGFVRFNPKTERWIVYENPEPTSLNRYQWIDNSTTPPSVWYADFQTQMFVRIQPLE
jgi:streptogramin lyase